MGVMSLFGKGPLTAKKIDKVAKLASNPFAQPDVRMREMQRLLDDGSPAALRGVLRRFAANAHGAIADEDEKKWLEDAMVDMGDIALEPLRGFIRTETQITYALRAYRRLAGDSEAIRLFLETLEKYGPEDHRSSEAKLQLIWQLSEFLTDAQVLPALAPFLRDHSDDVRWAIMDLLERAADRDGLAADVLAQLSGQLACLVLEADVVPRIQQRAAHIFAEREWQVPGQQEALAPTLEDVYFLDKKRYVRRRVKRRE